MKIEYVVLNNIIFYVNNIDICIFFNLRYFLIGDIEKNIFRDDI